ncbi:Secondary metabolism regulator LAE1 [Colletotrichum higginsianum]|uniref:Secondary metabolism regulator LAE1 n=1 Tax=Colletotrichum higginsianum TaxID=80884 RepID=A0A4T0VYC0_9PEZI|nr:Secondary metabolism regulator LAE1 [Colletotrichum higginsianum]
MADHAQQPAAEDFETDDGASSIGDSSATDSLASLRSSILDYRRENGRTYHSMSDGKYVLPNDEVFGVDLSPIQPEFVPPNCSFEVDDVEKEWTWKEPFDFIFIRCMIGSFASWPDMIAKAYEVLGWTSEETRVFCAHVRNEQRKIGVHAYYDVYGVWGRKPEKTDEDEETAATATAPPPAPAPAPAPASAPATAPSPAPAPAGNES